MNNPLIDSRDIRYVLFEMLNVESLASFEKFSSFDRDTFEDVLDLVEKIAVQECYPRFAEADRDGCSWDPKTGAVSCPDAIKAPLKAYHDAGFIGIVDSPEIGGMGMPQAVGAANLEFISAAHQPLLMYAALAHGSMMLIQKFGTEEQKRLYVPKMMKGEWGGTMCLTEPDAGSDVGRLATRAVKQPDGTYRIFGQKIFISAGENDIYANMIHPVLARIEGDPDGTKGISIFIVPTYRLDENGEPGEFNDVRCAGIERKMGIKSCVTCTMSFGDDGACVGYLLGSERQGMKIMFNMMNSFRMGCAIQAQGVSSAALLHAASYAKNRRQGVSVRDMANPSAPMVPIIEHPDVARMLVWMKSYVDAQRILIYFMFHNMDLAEVLDGEDAKAAQGLVEFLVPICKAGCSDMNVMITSEAMQVFGGYGFCGDYPIEQMMRNSKILAIFEGANGIQGMDLVMRKLLMNPGQYNYNVFKRTVSDTIEKAAAAGIDAASIDAVRNGLDALDAYVGRLASWAAKGRFAEILAVATPFRKATYMLAIAWIHLWSLTVSYPKFAARAGDRRGDALRRCIGGDAELAFYYGRVCASRFYLMEEFPQFYGILDTIRAEERCVLDAFPEVFTGTVDM